MPLGPVCNEAKVEREEEQDYDIPLQDGVMQPLTPLIVHITPSDDDYVAPATNLILDKHLNEFRKDFFDMIGVDENGNFIEDIKELSIKTHVERTRALKQEMWDLDVENKQDKNLKASYGVTTPQELRRMKFSRFYLRIIAESEPGHLTL
nr:hypothetical protein [Tanacetum cinerariifolium]